MKKFVKSLAAATAALALFAAVNRPVTAVGFSPEPVAVSPALAVLSGEVEMIKTGLSGSAIRFSPEDFEEALGVEKLASVEILSLPSAVEGKLMLGSLEVMKNQTVSRANLSSLRFVPTSSSGKVESSFSFRAGKEQVYDVTCVLHLIEEPNFSPTAAGVEADRLTLSTYKNIAVFGRMAATDPENDGLSYQVVSYPKKGLLLLTDRQTGDFVYTPTKNFTGRDSFTYTVTDVYGNRSEEIKMELRVDRSQKGTVFSDLIGQSCHTAAIRLSDLGVMTGEGEGKELLFHPDGGVTRAEFLTMAMKTAKIPVLPESVGATAFPDDGEIPAAYRPYVIEAERKGFLDGLFEGEAAAFSPNREVTLAEACVILRNILDAKAPESKPVFSDADQIPAFAEEAVYALCEKEIIRPENGVIRPTALLSRGETAEILARVLEG